MPPQKEPGLMEDMPVTILLIDDDPWSRRLLRQLLETTLNVSAVVEIGNSREGLRLARDLRPAMVLMDIATLRQEGLEAIRWIKAEQPATKVIVLTHPNDRGRRMGAIQDEVDALLPKEILTQKLLHGVGSSVLKRRFAARCFS